MLTQPPKGARMMKAALAGTKFDIKAALQRQVSSVLKNILKYRWLYLMMIPGLLYLVFMFHQGAFRPTGDFPGWVQIEISPL